MNKKKIIVAILVILTLLAVIVVEYNNKKMLQNNNKKVENKVEDNAEDEEEKEGRQVEAIDFKLEDLQGKEIKLSDFKGKRVFLNFWATWCGPCRAEMPYMQQLHEEIKDKDIVILAVNVGEDKDKVQRFIEENKYSFPILLDIKQEVATQYGISAFPTSFFIDEEGYVYGGIRGAMSLDMMKDHLKIK